MTRAQSAFLWEQSKSTDEATRKGALLALAKTLRNRPRSALSADELEAVRAWEAEYRQRRREAAGDALKEEHRDYCRHKAQSARYQQKHKEYRLNHREQARVWVEQWREEHPERVAVHTARQKARRHGEDMSKLGDALAARQMKERTPRAPVIANAVERLALFLADGAKTRSECVQHLHILDGEFDAILESATHALSELWEDDEGSLGLGYR